MARYVVDVGAVTSWAGTANGILIAGGALPAAYTLSIDADEFDQTGFASGGQSFMSYIKGLNSWTADITMRLGIPQIGNKGLFDTASATGVLHSRAWTMAIAATSKDVTVHNGSGVTWREFLPGLLSWGGTVTAHADTAVGIPTPASFSAVVFKLIENTSNDHTFTGDIILKNANPVVQVGEAATVQYNYRGTSTLTAAGSTGTGVPATIFAAAAIARPAVGSLVLTSAASRTYTGDAFWTGVNINCAVDQPIEVTVSVQGTGALTAA